MRLLEVAVSLWEGAVGEGWPSGDGWLRASLGKSMAYGGGATDNGCDLYTSR